MLKQIVAGLNHAATYIPTVLKSVAEPFRDAFSANLQAQLSEGVSFFDALKSVGGKFYEDVAHNIIDFRRLGYPTYDRLRLAELQAEALTNNMTGYWSLLHSAKNSFRLMASQWKEAAATGVTGAVAATAAVGQLGVGAAFTAGGVAGGSALVGAFAAAGAGVGVGLGCGINALFGEPCLGDWGTALAPQEEFEERSLAEEIKDSVGDYCVTLDTGGRLCGDKEAVGDMLKQWGYEIPRDEEI